MDQCNIWLPRDLHQLVKADHLNLSAFVRELLEELYSDRTTVDRLNEKFRLMHKTKESRGRQRALMEEEEENRERVLERVRQNRDTRRAGEDQDAEHRQNLEDAWQTLDERGDIDLDRIARSLPDNDPHGDRWDYLEDLTTDLSRVNGDTFTPPEVIAYAKRQCSSASG
jgi:hypothetical protein